jgi:hypothetical protein
MLPMPSRETVVGFVLPFEMEQLNNLCHQGIFRRIHAGEYTPSTLNMPSPNYLGSIL